MQRAAGAFCLSQVVARFLQKNWGVRENFFWGKCAQNGNGFLTGSEEARNRPFEIDKLGRHDPYGRERSGDVTDRVGEFIGGRDKSDQFKRFQNRAYIELTGNQNDARRVMPVV